MMRLHPTLTMEARDDEPPASYLSCVAGRIGRAPDGLAGDIGTTFQQIVDGVPDAISRLILACRLPQEAFANSTITKLSDRLFQLGPEIFPRGALTRAAHRICLSCARRELSKGTGPHDIRARRLFSLAIVYACPEHAELLVPANGSIQGSGTHDFCWHITQGVEDGLLDRHVEHVRGPSRLVDYVSRRLNGTVSGSWLDEISAHAVSRFAEVLGAEMVRSGKPIIEGLSQIELHEAGDRGFAVLAQGKEAVTEEFRRMQSERGDNIPLMAPVKLYGYVHKFLSYINRDGAFAPFRQVLHDHIVATAPLGVGDVAAGLPVVARRLHSVHSAHRETGIHPVTLRKRLLELGVISRSDLKLSDDRILFNAEAAKEMLEASLNVMTREKARTYLNLSRKVAVDVLTPEFVPITDIPGARGPLAQGFHRSDLDGFLERLLRQGRPSTDSADLHDIPATARRANCAVSTVVRLLLDGRLSTVAIAGKLRAWETIWLDPEEVARLVHPRQLDRLTLSEAARHARLSLSVVAALAKSKLIPSLKERHWRVGGLVTTVSLADLDDFNKQYVSLWHLSKLSGLHIRRVKAALVQAGVEEALHKSKAGCPFYRRREAVPIF